MVWSPSGRLWTDLRLDRSPPPSLVAPSVPGEDGIIEIPRGRYLASGIGAPRMGHTSSISVKIHVTELAIFEDAIRYMHDHNFDFDGAGSINYPSSGGGSNYFLNLRQVTNAGPSGQLLVGWGVNFKRSVKWTTSVALLLLPTVYGALHLTAMRFSFPTATESMLWTASCIVLMVVTPVASPVWEICAKIWVLVEARIPIRSSFFLTMSTNILGRPLVSYHIC